MTPAFRPVGPLLVSGALALTLGACKFDNRPLLARDTPPPAYGLPTPGPLALADQRGYVEPAAAYAYPQRAYATSRAFRSAPPSNAFAYGGEEPWAWQAADRTLMFAEPFDAGYRYYYYEPGRAYPYFVQAPDYGYAYGDNGALLALFDAAGVLLSGDRYAPQLGYANQYWLRAHDLNQAYWASPRYPIRDTVWRERAPRVWAAQDLWFDRVQAQPQWRAEGRHDNGLHRGWYKDRGRAVAVPASSPAVVISSDPVRRDERQAVRAEAKAQRHAAQAARREDPGAAARWRLAQADPPPAHGGDHGQGRGGKHGGDQGQGHGNSGGKHAGGQGQGGGDKHGHGKP